MNSPNPEKTLVVIVGPTASGKTAVSICLAEAYGSEIISSDSRQIYQEMSIGTAKPTLEELSRIPHHMIGVRSVKDNFSCGAYEQEAIPLINHLFEKHDLLFLVGGSGLYVDAVCEGMDAMPSTDLELRSRLNRRLEEEGLEVLQKELERADPAYYAQMDRHNPQRIVRALEVCLQTGEPYSLSRRGNTLKRPFRILKLGIRMPRKELYERIDQRVEKMIELGLEMEARALYPFKEVNALQTVGYRELFDYFDGLHSLDRAIELIQRNSRRYAKRQECWLGRDLTTHWVNGGEAAWVEAKTWLDSALHLV